MGATFRSSPSGDLSCHFDPSPLGRGLHHHVEVAGRWCRKKKKKIFARKFASSLACSSNAHDLGKFSASQKIVLSSSRRQGIFEDLQASRPRPRTSNCVLEDYTFGNHRALYYMVHTWRNVRVTYANRTLLLNIKFLAK